MISPELLRRFTFFAGFSDQELKQLAMAGDEQTIAEAEVLFAEGEPAKHLYFLTDGEIEILIRVEESRRESVPLSTLSAGELLGWSALIEPHVYTASARATRPCRVVAFDGAALEEMIAEARICGLLMKKVAQVISLRLKDTRIQLLSLAERPA